MVVCTSADGGTQCFWVMVAVDRATCLHHVSEFCGVWPLLKASPWNVDGCSGSGERSGTKANDVCLSSVVLDQQHQRHLGAC